MKTQLRKASDLRIERLSRHNKLADKSHEIALARAIEGINKAHNEGQTSFTDLTYPDGMGDMDSHKISWE